MSTFVIAEAGVNHNGNVELACSLIEEAAKAGADAVKFQTFTAESIVSPSADKATYQTENDGPGSQFEMLKSLELSQDEHRLLMAKCAEKGIEFMSTPFDEEALSFLVSEGMKRIKVPSGEITNTPYLRQVGSKGLPIILSTGMASLEEITEAVEALNEGSQAELGKAISHGDLIVLHCTSNYPAHYEDVNLRAMQKIAEETGLPVGYSDHTIGISVCPAAVAMGACVVEKHFTLDKQMAGPDHKTSLVPEELSAMISQIRDVEIALGSSQKQPSQSEMEMRVVARRGITAAVDLKPGDKIAANHISILRPAKGIAPKHFDELIGRTVSQNVKQGEPLNWEDLETAS